MLMSFGPSLSSRSLRSTSSWRPTCRSTCRSTYVGVDMSVGVEADVLVLVAVLSSRTWSRSQCLCRATSWSPSRSCSRRVDLVLRRRSLGYGHELDARNGGTSWYLNPPPPVAAGGAGGGGSGGGCVDGGGGGVMEGRLLPQTVRKAALEGSKTD